MVRTQIQLTEEQARLLKQRAAQHGVSMAQIVREAVQDYLDRAAGVDSVERKRRAWAAAGQFHSGREDIAEDHDRYLSEAFGDADLR